MSERYGETVTNAQHSRPKTSGHLYWLLVIPIGYAARRVASGELTPGHLVGIAAVAAAVAAFVVWRHRRTSRVAAKPKRESSTPEVVASEPMLPPVPGRCRWCGLRPKALICGKRSGGGPCEEAPKVVDAAAGV